jgi:HSP20 family molecular chaperone IbpA
LAEKVVVPPHMFACLNVKGENYIVEVDLLGVNRKDIDLSMHEDHLCPSRKRRPNIPWASTFPHKGQVQEKEYLKGKFSYW